MEEERQEIVFKISRSLMFGFIIVSVTCVGLVIWNLAHYKDLVANSCTESVSDAKGAFQPAICNGITNPLGPIIVCFVVFVISVILAIFAYHVSESVDLDESIDFTGNLIVSIIFASVVAFVSIIALYMPFSTYESQFQAEKNVKSIQEWASERYGMELSDMKAQSLYLKKADTPYGSISDTYSMKTKDGKRISLAGSENNGYQIVYSDSLDELPLTDAAKK